ncbi:Hypothetical protein, putative [Bodo saltans]|uniref:Uncharacterized protein n=1 Tax=Bodo saltans TaxID=75058 RepID=A0A0S4IUK3_BODSA|nr:Hypothetical protein, putative [Bodo saltans]|eukprot:CUF33181.1 Hypothetical protein, putative [Bodo saltans]
MTRDIATSFLQEHGIDPALLISVDLNAISSAMDSKNRESIASTSSLALKQHHTTRKPTRALDAHSENNNALAARPTSVNFPTNAYYRSVMENSEVVLNCREVLAMKPKEQQFLADDPRLKSDAQVEDEVRLLLTTRSYNPLPVLEELDRDLRIQKAALERHSRYKEQYDHMAPPQEEPVLRIC